MKLSNRHIHLLITFIAVTFFLPYLGMVHLFDWDEINFAEAAREMLVTGDWSRVTIGYEPFWEKPPLFIWLQALSMKIFGVGEFAARLPNALAGIATLNLLYHWGHQWHSRRLGIFWSIGYLGSITPFFYFKTGIIDPVFNLFILLAIVYVARSAYLGSTSSKYFAKAGLFIGLAVLTKGPVAVLILALVMIAIWVVKRFVFYFNFTQFVALVATSAVITSLWFLPETIANGTGVLENFIQYQLELSSKPVASHGQPWYYHIVVLLIGCFPISVFALPRLLGKGNDNEFDKWMLALFWVVLIVFSSVTTKIVHYSSLCWFPLAYFAARSLERSDLVSRLSITFYALIGVVLGIVLTLIPWLGANILTLPEEWIMMIKDKQVQAILAQNVEWAGMEWYIGFLFLIMVVFSTIMMVLKKWKTEWFVVHAFAVAFIIGAYSLAVVPKIERYVQGEIIDFYTELQDKEVYVETLHFKSYADLFYPQVKPFPDESNVGAYQKKVLDEMGVEEVTQLDAEGRNKFGQKMNHYYLYGELDRPTYLVIEARKMEKLSNVETVEFVRDAGPFLVYKRRPLVNPVTP